MENLFLDSYRYFYKDKSKKSGKVIVMDRLTFVRLFYLVHDIVMYFINFNLKAKINHKSLH